ncbi:cytochrome c biogenesis protein CcsA [Acetonema longum]|uniref:Cytochrome c assembly protein n=1 Tax=Acetonema longum DSM 6540 TaxID=1009370 RepID=F7NMJ9_9FIRM|nr:cytochrome c biogenesis protein CcsA [Acetonema longum]EGO62739.1 cytochrome c assembly protein [Acetonema longum DSM 6540]
MTGFAALFLALVITGIAAFCYFNAHFARITGRTEKTSRCALYYQASAACIAAAAAYLLFIILTDRFQFAYVFGYSARDLPLVYKISAFWAGQEGSFMLWLLFHALFGVIMSRKGSCPPGTMAVYCLVQIVLTIVLLAKSPFMMLTGVRADGAGLNPLLQDPWMAVHPPVIFLGYAGLAVPFAYALGGLLASNHRDWLRPALAWTLMAWAMLGAGIFIGGFWAYKVLGWGGYWAWDPVENSSLVPWLVCGALIHVLIIARLRPAAVKPAYFAAISAFVLVLYGTFLTRSGVLSNFSTHSFADEGVGGLLAGLVMIVVVASLILLIVRWPGLPEGEIYPALKSREFLTAAGALALSAIAVLVLIGMSTPLITMLINQPQSVSADFYNSTSLPLAMFLMLFLTMAPMVSWGETKENLIKKYWWLVLLGHLSLLPGILAGFRHPVMLAVAGLSVTALFINLAGLRKVNLAAGLTHAGVAVALIGILASSAASRSVIVSFEPGETQAVFGRQVTYPGIEPAEDGKGFYQPFQLDGREVVKAYTKFDREGRPAVREPGIFRETLGDLYFAPAARDEHDSVTELILDRGDEQDGAGLTVKFLQSGMNGNNMQNVRAYALLEVSGNGKREEVKPELFYADGQFQALPVKALGSYEVSLLGVNTSQGKVKIGVKNLETVKPDKIDVEISYKPLIGLVWLGTFIVVAGTLWAGLSRAGKVSAAKAAQALSAPEKSSRT